MDLPSLPILVERELVGVDLGQEPEHGRSDRSRAAVPARPTVAAMNRDPECGGHGPASLDFNPTLSDLREDLFGLCCVVAERRRD